MRALNGRFGRALTQFDDRDGLWATARLGVTTAVTESGFGQRSGTAVAVVAKRGLWAIFSMDAEACFGLRLGKGEWGERAALGGSV